MKAILKFSLPEEANEHQEALVGGRLLGLLHTHLEELRQIWKYSEDQEDVAKALWAKDMLLECIRENGLSEVVGL